MQIFTVACLKNPHSSVIIAATSLQYSILMECLYTWSKIELWPIFLAINELPPKCRFSRENMLFVEMWQWNGKPHFYQYMKTFSDGMNHLYNVGVQVEQPQPMVIKLGVVCSTLDLPAKAGILNMTYFNGAQACVLCGARHDSQTRKGLLEMLPLSPNSRSLPLANRRGHQNQHKHWYQTKQKQRLPWKIWASRSVIPRSV